MTTILNFVIHFPISTYETFDYRSVLKFWRCFAAFSLSRKKIAFVKRQILFIWIELITFILAPLQLNIQMRGQLKSWWADTLQRGFAWLVGFDYKEAA